MSTKTNPAQLSSAAAASLAPPPGDASPPIGDVFPSPACSSSAAFPSPACPFSSSSAAGASGLPDRSGSVASPGRPSCEAPSRSSSESFDLDPAPNRQKPSTLQRRAARHERDSMRRQDRSESEGDWLWGDGRRPRNRPSPGDSDRDGERERDCARDRDRDRDWERGRPPPPSNRPAARLQPIFSARLLLDKLQCSLLLPQKCGRGWASHLLARLVRRGQTRRRVVRCTGCTLS